MPSAVLDTPPILLDFPSLPGGVFKDSPVTAIALPSRYSREGGNDGLIGSDLHCSFVYRIDQVGDGQVSRTWVPCNRWICRWCRERKILTEARRFVAGFDRDGREVHRADFGTREQATNAVRYATKLGHSALVIPISGGGAAVFTTHPRRGAVCVHGELREQLESFLSQVPGHTKDSGEHRVINPNRVLGALLMTPEEFRAHEIRKRRQEYMDPWQLALTERAEAARMRLYGTPQFDTWIEKLDLVLTRSQFGHIMSYRIPDPGAEPMLSMLFQHEFERLAPVPSSMAA